MLEIVVRKERGQRQKKLVHTGIIGVDRLNYRIGARLFGEREMRQHNKTSRASRTEGGHLRSIGESPMSV